MDTEQFNQFIGTIRLREKPSLKSVKLTKEQYAECLKEIQGMHLDWDHWLVTQFSNIETI